MVLKDLARLRRENRLPEALALLRKALGDRTLAPEELDGAGRFIRRALDAPDGLSASLNVLVLGQCTTSFLCTALGAVAYRHGTVLRVEDGGYDSVMQDLMTRTDRPDVLVMVPWHQRLFADDGRSPDQRVDDELAFWRQVWSLVEERGSRLVQVGYDWMGPGPLGYGRAGGSLSPVSLVRRTDDALLRELPKQAFFVDLRQISSAVGRRRFYDARSYHWTKQPFSSLGLEKLSEHLWAGIRALTTGPKKVLVLDLDNTLWGGVVGEEGPLGIRLGDDAEGHAYRAMQKYCRGLRERGILLAACSKNNSSDALEPFQKHADMILKRSDFAAFEASWDAKSVALRRISETLRLSTDSFVFFDDNPAERQEVRLALPEVDVVEVPEDPAAFVETLEDGLYFEAATINAADQERATQYAAEEERRRFRAGADTIDAYLTSLDMVGDVRFIDDVDMPRVVQLIGKTNQWNLTTRRHSDGDVRRLLGAPGSLGLTLRLKDRFGDYGLVGVVLAAALPEADVPTLRIDTWLMSCRVIARTVEEFMMNSIASGAASLGYRALVGEFIPTAKNALVADLFPRFGFVPWGGSNGDVSRFRRELGDFVPMKTFVARRRADAEDS